MATPTPTPDMSSRTIDGLLAFCDWLKGKNYLGANAAEALKSAVKSVFATVEPEGYGSIALDGLDLDEYVRRFRVARGAKYKVETVAVYEQRIRRAIEAQEHYLKHGTPPTFRQHGTNGEAPKAKTATAKVRRIRGGAREAVDVFDASIPLTTGQVLTIPNCPKSWAKRDVERVSSFLESLIEEQRAQIPAKTGEPIAA